MNRSDILTQSKNYKSFLERCGWQSVELNRVSGRPQYIFIWHFPLTSLSLLRGYGLVAPIPLDKVDKLAKVHRSYSIRIEPSIYAETDEANKLSKQLLGFGYKKDDWCHFPSKTTVVDLSGSLSRIFTNFKQKTRNILRKAEKQRVSILILSGRKLLKEESVFNNFFNLLNKTCKRLGIFLYRRQWLINLIKSYNSDCFLVSTTENKRMLAVSFFITTGKRAYYIYSASTAEGKKMALPTLIIWEAIKKAKEIGCRSFDLEGIYDERYYQATKQWKGFTKFKLGFGGDVELFMGSFIKYPKLRLGGICSKIIDILWYKKERLLPSIYPEPF